MHLDPVGAVERHRSGGEQPVVLLVDVLAQRVLEQGHRGDVAGHHVEQEAVERPVLTAEGGDVVGEDVVARQHAEQPGLFGLRVRPQHAGDDRSGRGHGVGVTGSDGAPQLPGGVDDLHVLGHEPADHLDRVAPAVAAHHQSLIFTF